MEANKSQKSKKSLATKMSRIQGVNVTTHEIARELRKFQEEHDVPGLLELRDAYLIGYSRIKPRERFEEVRRVVYTNLNHASRLAEVIKREGYKPTGQENRNLSRVTGPITRFVRDFLRY